MYKVEALLLQVRTQEEQYTQTRTRSHTPTHPCVFEEGERKQGNGLLQPESILKSSMPCGPQCSPTPDLNTKDQT